MKKKLIGICFILIMMLSIMPAFVRAEAPVDVKDTRYEQATEILMTLGIIGEFQDGLFNPDVIITRAELATIIANMLGIKNEIDVTSEQYFIDVNKEHWAVNQINAMAKLGILNGYGDKLFRPDEFISIQQAVKALVSALGYDIKAINSGGYPFGYLKVASDLKLLSGVEGSFNDGITRGNLALMLYNAIDVDIAQKNSFGNDETSYEIIENETVLSKYLDINKDIGIVTANNITMLTRESTLKEDEVMIDNKIYKSGITNAAKFLGYEVVYYYKNLENDERELLYLSPRNGRNNTLTISADDLLIHDIEFSRFKLITEKAEKRQHIEISKKADVIYNNIAYNAFDDDTFKIFQGEIVLIDINNDNSYDVVFVYENVDYVVLDVNQTTEKINDKYGRVVDLNSEEKKVMIIKNNELISIKEILKNDIITVEESGDGKFVKVYASSNTVTGELKEVGSESNKINFTIDEKKYKISNSCFDKMDLSQIKVGETGVFYLNYKGNISATNIIPYQGKKYGYLVGGIGAKGLSDELKLEIYTSQGKFEMLKCEKGIKVNGSLKDQNGQKYDATSITAIFVNPTSGILIPQLISYETNEAGELIEVNKAKQTGPKGFDLDNFTLDAELTNAIYRGTSMKFGRDYGVNTTTAIFKAPTILANGSVDKSSIAIMNISNLLMNYSYNIDLYDTDRTKVAKAAVVKNFDTVENERLIYNFTVINKISKTTDKEGLIVDKIQGLSAKKEIIYNSIDNNLFSGIKRGDLCQVVLDLNGNAFKLKRLFAFSDINNTYFTTGNATADSTFGKIYAKSETAISVAVSNDIIRAFGISAGTPIYKINTQNGVATSVEIGNLDDIISTTNYEGDITNFNGSKVFVQTREELTVGIVIIN